MFPCRMKNLQEKLLSCAFERGVARAAGNKASSGAWAGRSGHGTERRARWSACSYPGRLDRQITSSRRGCSRSSGRQQGVERRVGRAERLDPGLADYLPDRIGPRCDLGPDRLSRLHLHVMFPQT